MPKLTAHNIEPTETSLMDLVAYSSCVFDSSTVTVGYIPKSSSFGDKYGGRAQHPDPTVPVTQGIKQTCHVKTARADRSAFKQNRLGRKQVGAGLAR